VSVGIEEQGPVGSLRVRGEGHGRAA
jgi:hypothetical protein